MFFYKFILSIFIALFVAACTTTPKDTAESSGSGSTGQLNLPSWFQHGAGKNAKLDADGRIYGYN